jgi:hypothetical protein
MGPFDDRSDEGPRPGSVRVEVIGVDEDVEDALGGRCAAEPLDEWRPRSADADDRGSSPSLASIASKCIQPGFWQREMTFG